MPHDADLARVFFALFYSGVFWMMLLFLLEKRSTWRGSVLTASVLLVLSAYQFLGAVTHGEAFAILPPSP